MSFVFATAVMAETLRFQTPPVLLPLLLCRSRRRLVFLHRSDGPVDDILSPVHGSALEPLLRSEEVPVHPRVDSRKRSVRNPALDSPHDAPDIVAAVQEPEPLRIGNEADDVECVALEPVAHIDDDGSVSFPLLLVFVSGGELAQPHAEQVGARVHGGLLPHNRGQGVGALEQPAVAGVPGDVELGEKGRVPRGLADRVAPRRVPVRLGQVLPAQAVEHAPGVRVADAEAVGAASNDGAFWHTISCNIHCRRVEFDSVLTYRVSCGWLKDRALSASCWSARGTRGS